MRATSMLLLAAAAACSGGGSPPSPTAPQELSVQLLPPPTGGNPAPRVLVAMPSASPFSMLVDTGSTGLRIYPSALSSVPSSSYANTGQNLAAVFGDDRVVYGTLAVAKAGIVIGGRLRIEKAFDFEIVDAVCAGVPSPVPSAAPANCDNVTAKYEADLIGGTFGVRPMTTNALLSPLAELPQPYSDGFVVSDYGSSPKLTVGTTAQNQSGFELYQVGATTATDGSPGWTGNDELPWCYAVTVPGSSAVDGCPGGGVLTDSGGITERLSIPAAPPAMLAPNTVETLPPDTTIVATLAAAGSTMPAITWTMTTGSCAYYDAPDVYFDDPSASPTPAASSTPISSNAIAPFYTNDVLYDLRGGTFGFRPVTVAPPAFCS